MPSVVIPAHNESATIQKCIRSIVGEQIEGLQIVVVANGCSDTTANLARNCGAPVQVIDVEKPGKTNALNIGEQYVSKYPRAFVDGDIVIEPGALKAAFDTVKGKVHLVSPSPRFEMAGASFVVRLFYKALDSNPYFGSGSPNGSGIFVVSEDGRARWGLFPDLIADDGYVEAQFAEHEKATSVGPRAIVRVPRNLRSLLRIQARSRVGTQQLKRVSTGVKRPPRSKFVNTMTALLRKPQCWDAAVVYLFVRLMERFYWRLIFCRRSVVWLRDTSSRVEESTRLKNRV